MPAALALLTLHAALIAVEPGPADACPSSVQVAEAVRGRLPGALVGWEHAAGGGDVLRLTLATTAAVSAPSFALVDVQRRVRLRRTLPAPVGPADCLALAESIALIVERHLQGLTVADPPAPARSEALASPAADAGLAAAAPPASPERRRWELSLGGGWRSGGEGAGAYQVVLGVGRLLGDRRRLLAGAALGAGGASPYGWTTGSADLRRLPADLRLAWRPPLGPLQVEAGGFAGVEWLRLRAHAGDRSHTIQRLAPVVGLAVGLRLPLGPWAFVRLAAGLGLALVRYEFTTPGIEPQVAFRTQRVYTRALGEAGIAFW